jgi:hypothetical protein
MGPSYYRYIYSPTSTDVTLSHNEGPIQVHSEMAKTRPEKDLEYGYAIKQANGWAVYDDEDKQIKEPNKLWKVQEAIRNHSGDGSQLQEDHNYGEDKE